jgi:predicted CXXCH cytochrome family protein
VSTAALAMALTLAATPPPGGTCEECHAGLSGDLAKPAVAFAGDIHVQAGLGCATCHGGDPTSDDPEVAMSRAKGFRGVPAAKDIPTLCGGCHANVGFVKRFAPNLPTDQLARYQTSRHARELATGNPRAAVCSSCHEAHGIVSTKDPRSPVYPTRVVDTCGRCHSRPGDSGPVEQWRKSVHAAALAAGDLSAPTCPSCHGSHGAAPPGIDSVPAVCGQCHPRNMELFRASPHRGPFEAASIGACLACHGNHDIARPTDARVGLTQGAVCAQCHSSQDGGGKSALAIRGALDGANELLAHAAAQVDAARARGMLMEDAQVALHGAREQIVEARTLVHTVDSAQVEAKTNAADTRARTALADAGRAFGEVRYRRTGLLVALVLIVIAIAALVLKIRETDAMRR